MTEEEMITVLFITAKGRRFKRQVKKDTDLVALSMTEGFFTRSIHPAKGSPWMEGEGEVDVIVVPKDGIKPPVKKQKKKPEPEKSKPLFGPR